MPTCASCCETHRLKNYRNLSSSREWECLPYAYQAHGKQYFHCISVVFEVANALAVLSWNSS